MTRLGMVFLAAATILITVSITIGITFAGSTSAVNTQNSNRSRGDDGTHEERGFFSTLKDALSFSRRSPRTISDFLNRKTPVGDVFVKLKLAKAGDTILDDPQFHTWVTYVDDFKLKYKQTTSMIPTLAAHYNDDALLMILEAAKKSVGMEKFATRLKGELVQWSMATWKHPATVFKFLDPQIAKEMPQILTWVKYVDDFNLKYPKQATTMVPILTTRFNADALYKILEAVKISKDTKIIVPKLQAQLTRWAMGAEMSPTIVFKYISPGLITDLLQMPQFFTWIKYVDDFNMKHPQEKTSMVPGLRSLYPDTGIRILLETARKSENTKNIATRLETELLQWSMATGTSPTEMFKFFAPKELTERLLQMPQFAIWLKYANDFKAKHPGNDAAASLAMMDFYGDKAVFNMLETAAKTTSTKTVAAKLQKELWDGWLTKKTLPSYVFEALALDEAGDTVFSNPKLSMWINYLNMFNKENPANKERMVSSFHNNYYTEHFWRITSMAMHDADKGTANIAKRLRAEKIDGWLSNKESPRDVFALLNLHKAEANLFSNENFRIWTKYLDDFNKRYPDIKTNTIQTVLASYSNEELVKILVAAKKSPDTEKLATNLQRSLLNTWMRELKDPAEVSKLLKVEMTDEMMKIYVKKFNWMMNSSTGDKVFDKPQLPIWLQYVRFYKAKHPGDDKSSIAILTAHYGDEALANVIAASKKQPILKELAQNVEADQLQNWLSSGKSSEDVFRLLKLDKTGENLLGSPLYQTWFAFSTKLISKPNQVEKVTRFDTLLRIYSEEKLSAILLAGMKDPSQEKQARQFGAILYQSWIKRKTNPEKIHKWMNVKEAAADSPEKLFYTNKVTNNNASDDGPLTTQKQ
ncbi:Hypothetical protein PHPALM_3376 [Phytophthora palmivora]|uniref:RxLR effector PexRD54 WY domain-containing protein n=1 Tax=Phytophthora palmivora TaxID=4796 RepID=A0A2P4YMJ5_9STRA|nr:Hypothetical protein PHPALM_3376 [Phytophthora palmivora]